MFKFRMCLRMLRLSKVRMVRVDNDVKSGGPGAASPPGIGGLGSPQS